ncbi:hypothetical protein BDR03DRAFT_1019257 [Suillus americanus]|nr:hypothetical protein BDR03DRAFT_1019257 [Suillus americanus]
MPSQFADAAPGRRTRPSNATAHPEKAAQVAAAEVGAKRIAGIELEMEAKQTNMLVRKAKGVWPRPIPSKGKKAVKDSQNQVDATAACGGGDEVGTKLNQEPEILTQMADALMDLDDNQDSRGELSTIKKKITKALLKDAVNQAHEQIKRTPADHGGDKVARVHKKGNSLDVIMKMPEYTLSNKVNHWVSGVEIPIKNPTVLSHVTHTLGSPPPSTIFSRLTGSSNIAHSEILTNIPKGPQCSGVDDVPGGCADDEDEDKADKLECLAAHGITAKEGRSAAAMALTLTIDDSDDELVIPAEFRAPFTQCSPVGLSKASFTVGSLKRKASEDLDLTLGSEIKDFWDDAINNKMDIDLLDKSDLTYGVKSEKPPHTTSSTSVMTTDVKPALTKKAKVLSTSLGATPAKPKEQQSLNVDMPHNNLKPRAQYRNTDLPDQVQADHRWAKKFLPTMMLWAGSQESLWSIPDATLLIHIQIVFQAVYPELNLAIVQNGAVFSLTVQQPSEWWSNFGSTAIAIIFDFLTSNNDRDPEVLAGLLLKNFAFIFEDMDKCEPDGAFHSAFMLQLLRLGNTKRE